MDWGGLSVLAWTLASLSAFVNGFSKTGVGGLGILAVPLMASVFPARESTGVLLPMLIFGDLFAIFFYRRHADWKVLFGLFPYVIPGVVAGYLFMARVDGQLLGTFIGVIVLCMLALKIFLRGKEDRMLRNSRLFTATMGFAAGFITMTSNAAGPVMAIYLLSRGFDKQTFVGTRAWYFFTINLFKVPFSASLGLITVDTLLFDAMLIPAIVMGALLGYRLIQVLSQKWFERLVLILASLGALKMVFS